MNDNWKYLAAIPPTLLWLALFAYMLYAERKMNRAILELKSREEERSKDH